MNYRCPDCEEIGCICDTEETAVEDMAKDIKKSALPYKLTTIALKSVKVMAEKLIKLGWRKK